jgi:hypothetical protein
MHPEEMLRRGNYKANVQSIISGLHNELRGSFLSPSEISRLQWVWHEIGTRREEKNAYNVHNFGEGNY